MFTLLRRRVTGSVVVVAALAVLAAACGGDGQSSTAAVLEWGKPATLLGLRVTVEPPTQVTPASTAGKSWTFRMTVENTGSSAAPAPGYWVSCADRAAGPPAEKPPAPLQDPSLPDPLPAKASSTFSTTVTVRTDEAPCARPQLTVSAVSLSGNVMATSSRTSVDLPDAG